MPNCNVDNFSPHELFKAFANVDGPTPNLFVSIHGGAPEESNYKAFKNWMKGSGTKDKRHLARAYTAKVPQDLIVVKLQKPMTNCTVDIEGRMEEDLRYLWSSPYWGIAGESAMEKAIMRNMQIFLPGDFMYNQWLQFDESPYMGIWKIIGGIASSHPDTAERGMVHIDGDPRRSHLNGQYPDGGAGGGMGPAPKGGHAMANPGQGQFTEIGAGDTLKSWSEKATSSGDDQYEHSNWRHFDMQTLLNYLSMPGVTQSDVYPGPWLDPTTAAAAKGIVDSVKPTHQPLRVVYFFSCSPSPVRKEMKKEAKALLGSGSATNTRKVRKFITTLRLKFARARE